MALIGFGRFGGASISIPTFFAPLSLVSAAFSRNTSMVRFVTA